jgi:uncharacterized protein YjbI with pentapeptide repeats
MVNIQTGFTFNHFPMKRAIQVWLVMLLLPALALAQSRVDARDILERINRGEKVAFRNARIEGDLDLTQLQNKKLKQEADREPSQGTKFYISTVTVPLSFSGCTFSGKVLGFYNPEAGKIISSDGNQEVFSANFEKEVLFENCVFEAEAAFKYSEFRQAASFAGSRFRQEAVFKYTKFAQGPNFEKTTFAQRADFKYATFAQGVSFEKADFTQQADFKYVKFPAGTSFRTAAFRQEADFKYAEFLKGADFRQATFSSFANFKNTRLSDPVSFTGASFKGTTDFKYTRLNGRAVNLATQVK